MSRSLETRIVAAAEEALARQKFVTPLDVCLGIGWLQPVNVRDWEPGRVGNNPSAGQRDREATICAPRGAPHRRLRA